MRKGFGGIGLDIVKLEKLKVGSIYKYQSTTIKIANPQNGIDTPMFLFQSTSASTLEPRTNVYCTRSVKLYKSRVGDQIIQVQT